MLVTAIVLALGLMPEVANVWIPNANEPASVASGVSSTMRIPAPAAAFRNRISASATAAVGTLPSSMRM